ncbi:hypothetical protein [Dyadobacter sandarakinus]|uniref:Uncharacterized protein n=1 Tax=Dyadobacter sandarakinus TaxID=2747268 RepID=A0ABX7IA26_9BACT|nr:hypothetical protein [Dyadobacter sandarakinus]QRR02013.1 hypothetical protein HWI92_14400 [Dyadobacter sandarakinus]
MNINHILKKVAESQTGEAYEKASAEALDYFAGAPEADREHIRKALLKKADEIMEKAVEARQRAAELMAELHGQEVSLEIDGTKYPLSEWVTMKEYCRRFGIKNTMIVNNWIARNVIPKENVLHISQLNNLRLIKAVPYKS